MPRLDGELQRPAPLATAARRRLAVDGPGLVEHLGRNSHDSGAAEDCGEAAAPEDSPEPGPRSPQLHVARRLHCDTPQPSLKHSPRSFAAEREVHPQVQSRLVAPKMPISTSLSRS
eukprot:7827454-Pyramimonas_sp.AAC.1